MEIKNGKDGGNLRIAEFRKRGVLKNEGLKNGKKEMNSEEGTENGNRLSPIRECPVRFFENIVQRKKHLTQIPVIKPEMLFHDRFRDTYNRIGG